MMQNKKLIVGSSLAVAVVLAGAFSMTSAYKGDPEKKGPNYTEERHEAMTKAFENKDYEAWKAQMGDSNGRVTEVIQNQEDFNKFVEMRNLMKEGKTEEASKIKEELGVGNNGQGFGYGKGGKYGKGGEGNENRGKKMGGFIDENNDGVCDHKPEKGK